MGFGKRKDHDPAVEKILSAFRFTDENGKPKSGRGIETFALSVVLAAFYGGVFWLVIDGLSPHIAALPAPLQNLLESVITAAAGLLFLRLLSRKLPLWAVFDACLWLLLYGLVCLVTLALLLWKTPGASLELVLIVAVCLFGIPVGSALLMLSLLIRKQKSTAAGHTQDRGEEKSGWEKYINTQR